MQMNLVPKRVSTLRFVRKIPLWLLNYDEFSDSYPLCSVSFSLTDSPLTSLLHLLCYHSLLSSGGSIDSSSKFKFATHIPYTYGIIWILSFIYHQYVFTIHHYLSNNEASASKRLELLSHRYFAWLLTYTVDIHNGMNWFWLSFRSYQIMLFTQRKMSKAR